MARRAACGGRARPFFKDAEVGVFFFFSGARGKSSPEQKGRGRSDLAPPRPQPPSRFTPPLTKALFSAPFLSPQAGCCHPDTAQSINCYWVIL